MSIPADDKLFQYRVDFEPDEERSFIRKMLVRDFHELLPKYFFDGTIMFTTQQLNNDKSPVVLKTRRKTDNALIQITIREVEEGEVLPMDNYYKQIKNLTDLSNEIKFKLGRPDAAELSRAMATDLSNEIKFKLGKAMAECTRQTPDEGLEPPTRFSQRSNDTPEIQQLLSDWKLKFAKEQEKFNANNPEVNWGNIIQKFRMTPSGFCGKWAVIYPPRDEGETKQFVTNLIKVSPSLGLVLGCPKTFKLLDDRPATYIQQLHKTMDMGPDLVMVVMPDNKGEHYHAMERKCCMEKGQMEKLVSSGKWAVIYPPRDEGPTKEEFGKDENDEKLKEFGMDDNGEKLKEFGMDDNGEKLKEFGMDENGEKLKQLEDEKDVVGCFSKFKAFMKQQWKKIVGCFGCLRPNTDLDKIREKGDKESLLPGSTFISTDGDLMKVGRSKLSK